MLEELTAIVIAGVLLGQGASMAAAQEEEGVRSVEEAAPISLAEFEQRLADWRVALETRGATSERANELGALLRRAQDLAGFESAADQASALAQVAVASAELWLRRGQREEALHAITGTVDPTEGEPVVFVSMAGGPEYRAEVARLVRVNAEFVALHDRLIGQDPDATLRQVVRTACEEGRFDLIEELGEPAWEPFAQWILTDKDSIWPDSDPLLHLNWIDEERTGALVLQNLDAGGILWKRRILAIIGDSPVDDGGDWTRVLERLLEDPATAKRAITEAYLYQVPASLREVLVRTALERDEEYARGILAAITRRQGPLVVTEDYRPLLEGLLNHPREGVRLQAAGYLSQGPDDRALLALADDPSAGVRRVVARSLGTHTVYERRGSGDPSATEVHPELDEGQRAVLRVLLRDEDRGVRLTAAGAACGLQPPLAEDAYLELASDPDPEVRVTAATARNLQPEVLSRVLHRITAGDLEGAPAALLRMILRNDVDPDPYVDSLGTLLVRGAFEPEGVNQIAWKLERSDRVAALTRWALAGVAGMTQAIIDRVEPEDVLQSGDADLAEFVARLAARGDRLERRPYVDRVVRELVRATPRRPAALRMLLEDRRIPPHLRVYAASAIAAPEDASWHALVLEALRSDFWKDPANERRTDWVVDLCEEMRPPETVDAFRLEIALDRSIEELVALRIVTGFHADGPHARDLANAVFERWYDADFAHRIVRDSIELQSTFGQAANRAVLERALGDRRYAIQAARAIAALRQPAYIPRLAECIDAPRGLPQEMWEELGIIAAQGLSLFRSDEASEALLSGLSSPLVGVRTACLEGLEFIRTARDEARRLEDARANRPTRESALAELGAMLEDENAEKRVLAIQGIAAFGALEYVPRLIAMFEDRDGAVATAARAAVTRMTSGS